MKAIFTKRKKYSELLQENNTLKLLYDEKAKLEDFMAGELDKASKRIRDVETENKKLKQELKEK